MWDWCVTNFFWLGGGWWLLSRYRLETKTIQQRLSRIDEDLTRTRLQLIALQTQLLQTQDKLATIQLSQHQLDRRVENTEKGVSLMTRTMESQASKGTTWSW